MSNLSSAFGKKFNKDIIRTRSFDFNGHTFKVRVPLSAEYEAILKETQEIDEAKVDKYYNELSKEFIEKKDTIKPEDDVIFSNTDIVVQGRSLKETAKNKILTDNRILAMIKLLVPEEKDFDMATITYEMVDELFPFSVQLELLERIGDVISPSYSTTKGK
jgi:hypothetical protein